MAMKPKGLGRLSILVGEVLNVDRNTRATPCPSFGIVLEVYGTLPARIVSHGGIESGFGPSARPAG